MADTQEKTRNTRSLLIYGSVVALAVAGLVAVFLWAGSTDYRVLYTGLSDDDMSAIITKLREKRIPYRVEAGLVKVPEDRLYEIRIELAGEGLPQGGGVGFEIFDKTGFGITEFAQKVNYVRALQGELARTITQMRKIEGARVHLVLPEQRAFLEEEKKARASVVVKLKPGAGLTGTEVQSIVHFVASSLPELGPGDITLVDTQGRLWTRPEEDEEFTQIYIARKRELERELEQKVQTMLERAVGKGKVVARVSVELDAKRVETTEESFDPDSQVVRSEQRSLEKSSTMAADGGIPGVVSNTPEDAQATQPATGMGASQRQNEIVNYEISRKVSKTIEPDGRIRRIAVAVLVDGRYETITKDDGSEEKNYMPRTEEEIGKFTNIVKNAVGFSEERGDTVTVENIPFEPETVVTPQDVEAEATMIPPYLIKDIVRIAMAGILMVVVFLFVIRPIIRRVVEENRALDSIQKSLSDGRLALERGEEHRMLGSGSTEAERLKELVRQNPQQAAIVIKNWLKE